MSQKDKSTYEARNSGKRARDWRRWLAASSIRPSGTVRTLKFKLDFPDGAPTTFDNVRALNRIIDGVGAGSLTGLLLTAHGSGFRVFSTEGEAIQFRSRANDASSFSKEFEEHSGLKLNGFDAAGLRKRFTKRPRARGGKDISFTPEVIAREYSLEFTGKSLEKLDSDLASFIQDWAALLHAEFQRDVDPWGGIAENVARAAKTVDDLCSQRGWEVSSVLSASPAMEIVAWESATVAFDPSQQCLDLKSPVLLHQIVSLRLRKARSDDYVKPTDLRKQVQFAITTATSSGLSWLFGNGLRRLKAASVEEVCEGLVVPGAARQSALDLKAAADTIGNDPVFDADSFSDYRRLVSGRLDSWIANYLNRLFELESTLAVTPEEWVVSAELENNFPSLVGRSTLTVADVHLTINQARLAHGPALSALNRLLGLGSDNATADDVQSVEVYAELVSEAFGKLKTIQNLLQQKIDDAVDAQAKRQAQGALFEIPGWLKELPKINRLTGAIPDFETELREAVDLYTKLDRSRLATLENIRKWCTEKAVVVDAVATLARVEMESAEQRRNRNLTDVEARQLAISTVLHRFGVASLGCSLSLRQAVQAFYGELGVFKNPKEANRFFLNRQGALYRSPFSRSRHESYAVDWSRVGEIDVLKEIDSFIRGLEGNALQSGSKHRSDVMRLRQSYDGIWLVGLGQDIPNAVAAIDVPEEAARCPMSLLSLLKQTTLTPDTVRRGFNLYYSAIRGLEVILGRTQFFVRARVQRVGDTALQYVPKNRPWAAPHRLWATDKPITAMLNDGFIEFTDEERKIVDPKATFDAFYSVARKPNVGSAAYLTQAPHDWCYGGGFAGEGSSTTSLLVDGKKGPSDRPRKRSILGRLIGPSSFKSELDKLLNPENGVTFGDLTLICDQSFTQSIQWGADGVADVKLEPDELSVSLAIPLSRDPIAEKVVFPLADRLVAIDQGEVGIGYAVYDVETRELVAKGNRRIPSIRRLIKSAGRYRSVTQRSQKFQQRFDSTLFQMRENVVGDVCHEICTLMRKYKAFPVLEDQVRNLEGGSRQLDLVYKAVSTRFFYSDTDAHATERTSYWQGGDRWEHPTLKKHEWKEGGKTEKLKALSLFPGASGPTGGTSQACHVCKRNPIKATAELAEASGGKLVVASGGKVTVKDGTIRLLTMTDDADFKRHRYARRNERVPLTEPIKAGKTSWEELRPILRRNLRQPPRSKQSRDTTQSTYHCVYADCGYVGHADENAALNIGRRFLEERVVNVPQAAVNAVVDA